MGKLADQKAYIYLAWMLWAFLQETSADRPTRAKTLYERLPQLANSVITFNYTDFFDARTSKTAQYFRGRLASYLACDTRRTYSPPELRCLRTPEAIVEFLGQRRLDVSDYPHIDIPAIVPPISFKPVMSRDQLRTWARCDDLLQKAGRVVVVGYSFAAADEHFNDLLRNLPASIRVLIVNPNIGGVSSNICRIMDVTEDTLKVVELNGIEIRQSRRITCLATTADNVDAELVEGAFGR